MLTWEEAAPEALRNYLLGVGQDVTSRQCARVVFDPRRTPSRQEVLRIAYWLKSWGYHRVSVRDKGVVRRVWRRGEDSLTRLAMPCTDLIHPTTTAATGHGTRAATEVKRWLHDMGWTQTDACRHLQVTDYAMRSWLTSARPVPLVAQLAMRWLRDHKHDNAISVTSTPHSGVDSLPTVCSDTPNG